jgi:hypothetical protein
MFRAVVLRRHAQVEIWCSENRRLQQHRNLSLRRAGIAMIAAGALVFLLATVSGIAYSLGKSGRGLWGNNQLYAGVLM